MRGGGENRATFTFGGGPPLEGVTEAAATGAAAAGATAGATVGASAPAAYAALSVSRRATTVCTATVCPCTTRISARMPAAGAGISASTLSVEISKIGSSRFTSSPTALSHRESVPSAIDSPICGMITSIRATDYPRCECRYAASLCQSRHTRMPGRINSPTIEPTCRYGSKLHAGKPSAGVHPLNPPTAFATATPIIPPEKYPTKAIGSATR